MSEEVKKCPIWLLVVSWLFVGVPAGWGVTQTIRASLPLFESSGNGSSHASPPTANPPANATPVPSSSPPPHPAPTATPK